MLKKVLHIGLTVSNLEKLIIFYRDILGLKYLG
ncbi:VOC family protein [Mergibacter septicus]